MIQVLVVVERILGLWFMGGVDHCSSYCRLAKFRGLMYQVKYTALWLAGTAH